MSRRALALALALLLLFTQQFGVQHQASHAQGQGDIAAPAAALGGTANSAAGDDHPHQDSSPADPICPVCLLLAVAALALLPAALRWRGPAWQGPAPLTAPVARLGTRASRPYQARAPPAPAA